MAELWTIGTPILLVDVANPVLLAAVILSMMTPRPMTNALLVILGHTVAYILTGLLIIFGLAEIAHDILAPVLERLRNPEPDDFVFGTVVGLALLWVAHRWRVEPPKPSENAPEPKGTGPVSYFFFGAVINFVGAPFAIPYIAFINQLLRMPDGAILPNLLLYNALYALPFLLVPASMALFGASVMPLLQRINAAVEKYSAYIVPVILALLGLVLLADAGSFFVTGQALI